MNTADQKRHMKELLKYLKGILTIMTVTRHETESQIVYRQKSKGEISFYVKRKLRISPDFLFSIFVWAHMVILPKLPAKIA